MSQEKLFQTIKVLTGILIITILLSECSAATYSLDDFDETDDKRDRMVHSLRHLLKRIQFDDDDDYNLLFGKRVAASTKKCTEIKSGTYYGGQNGPILDKISTYKDCMNQCEKDNICYGWSFDNSTGNCRLQTSITGLWGGATYMSGSCIGPAAKEQNCKETLSGGYYSGSYRPVIKNIATVQDCMSKCDKDATCMGWSYKRTDATCRLQTSVYGKINDATYTGGSCIIPQEPYPPPSIEIFRKQALDQHNVYRKKHCTPSLVLNSSLNDIAQAYAEKLAANNLFEHSGNKFYGKWMGENLWASSGSSSIMYTNGATPVTSWYSEIKSYNWSKPGFSMGTGHFTQLIWKDTKAVGIGRGLTSTKTGMYVVANYFPGGNMGGGYENNVKQLC